MRRRAFLASTLAVALGAPPSAGAQPARRVPRIGFFGPPPGTGGGLVQSFRQGLRELGYIEGQNARRATTTIPIVMANAADPVASGFVVSLARPGGNVTGRSRLVPELVGKQLELVTGAVPGIARIGVLANPDNALHAQMVSRARREASILHVEIESAETTTPGQFEAAVEGLSRKRMGAVLVLGDALFFLDRLRLGNLLLRTRLPSMFANTEHVEAGGLMSYAASSRENYRRAAYFVDKILRGAKPADLPVEQPTKLELVINLKTARALGLTIPSSVLLQADRVIE